jgi:5-methyltetrahydrofolate--homocysteine methyltransferase
VHVLDASRSVAVVSNLLSDDRREAFALEVANEYQEVRESHAARTGRGDYLTLADARRNRRPFDDARAMITKPKALGVHTFDRIDLAVLREFIDWTPFFQAWELPGKYPGIFQHPQAGGEARRLFDDASELLDTIIEHEWIRARGVMGLFRARGSGDDVLLFEEHGSTSIATLHTLRQQARKTPGRHNRALADFVAPADGEVEDYVGLFAVTAGMGVDEVVKRFEADHDDYRAILVKALADRLAEAAAEWLHAETRRRYWGYAADESLSSTEIIAEAFRGIRPAPGYPAQPDHTEKWTLWHVLDVARRTGIELTEHIAMVPASSVCGLYFAHPEADYFNVGLIGQDQVRDYAERKNMPVEEVERWLASRLNYEPEDVAVPSSS